MSDRKYRHRGYMDSGSPPAGPRPQGPPPELPRQRLEGAPRGRSAGAPGPEVFRCARCGEVHRGVGDLEIAQDAVCSCGVDLHACINCKHFDTSTQWECREQNVKARVSPKDHRNECQYFSPKIVRDLTADKASSSPGRPSSADDARKAFEDLFKK